MIKIDYNMFRKQARRERLEMKVSDLKPFLIGFAEYIIRNPENLTEDETSFRDKRALILANANVFLTSAIIYGIVEGIGYLSQ